MQTAEQLFSVKNKRVLITGGAGFLGGEYAAFLLSAGARAAIFDARPPAEIEKRIKAIEKKSDRRPLGFSVDVTDQAAVKRAADALVRRWGGVDALVNNAALTYSPADKESHEQFSPYESYPLDLWQRALDVGLTGALIATQAVIPVMKKQRAGVIINTGSIYGIVAHDSRIYQPGRFGSIAYATAKGALPNFTRELASYLGPFGIRANMMTLGGVEKAHDRKFVRAYASRTMLGRMARADEYNGALLFLISDASRYMTGANLIVDGGWSAW